ncbi:amidohydrolase [Colletotrichum graminicola]|nr:amidohydrolase [Colletotrichum graminicola]
MPGLWDVHTYFTGLDVITGFDTGLFNVLPGSNALRFRGLGPAIEKGRLVGSDVYSAITAMSITGGHGDQHGLSIRTVMRFAKCGGPWSIVDGADDFTEAVRLLVRRGARCIKADEKFKAIVEEAGRRRRAVAAHVIGKAGIMAALRAGVKSIEHVMYLDDEVADAMLEKGAIFVPTHHILAIKRGIKIALGTDSAKELNWAVENGMMPRRHREGQDVTGGMAPLSRQLKEGYEADLISVAKNPLDDIEVLVKKENITHVWKGGKLFKSP